jgi:CheY-like chemotaxis protein
MIRVRSIQKELTFDVDVDEILPKRLFGDMGKIKQILLNLLTNAVKYTDIGGFILSVSMVSREDATANISFSVKDTGMGIKEEDMKKLFTAYSRLDEEKNTGIQGTGLGLDISRRFAELMGGNLSCKSEYGEGSEFILNLSQKIIDPTPIGLFIEYDENKQSGPYVPQFIAPDADILVVDDNPMNLNVIKGLLKSTKVFVTTAESGEDAINKIKDSRFDIVLLDHMMPGMDGVEAFERIRKDEGIISKGVPVIVLTANAISGASQQYLEIGFADYLSKPIDADLLEKMFIKYLPPEKVVSKKNKTEDTSSQYGDAADNRLGAASGEAPADAAGGSLVDKAKGLESCDGREEVYQIAADMFIQEDYAGKLIKAFEDGNWKDYQIHVHGVKSSSKIVGAMTLHELAMNAEQSLKDRSASGAQGDEGTEFVRDNHSRLLDMIAEVKKELSGS